MEDVPEAVRARAHLMVRLALAYARRDYRGCRHHELVVLVAGLLYVASSDDTIPDFHSGGLRDDAAVVAFVAGVAAPSLDDFASWESRKGT